MIGPSLPPHLRKQIDEDVQKHSGDTPDSESAPAPNSASKASVTGPQLPPHLLAAREAKRKRKLEETESPATQPSPTQKRKPSPVLGPPLAGPSIPSAAEDSDSDDEVVGPSLAAMMTPAESAEYTQRQAIQRLSRTSPPSTSSSTHKEEPKPQRDSWMLAPPTRSDWLNTLDASKLKARTFNQSKSGSIQSGQPDHSEWTETPLERAQRIENQVLGRKPQKPEVDPEEERQREREEERDRRIKDMVKQTRGPSLMEKHVQSRKDANGADVDDPSKRGFDYQKDIAGGTVGFKERSAMINRAKNLEGKYSGGKYL